MTAVRLALIGAGTIGKRHLEAIASTPAARLVAIADPVAENRDLAAGCGAEGFADFDAMLDAIRPDGVIVATPTEHHLAPAAAALRTGAHVLVEKPITATLAEADTLTALSAETGRHVLVGHHRRYYPVVEKARDLVRGGALGDLVAVTGQWTTLKPDAYFDADGRRRRAAGPVLTNLIHEMDLLRTICGEVTHVLAQTSGHIRGHEKEETAALVLTFECGALATFILSDATPSPWTWEYGTGETPAFPRSGQNSWRFMGTNAALEFPNLVLWRTADGQRGWTHAMHPQALPLDLGDAFVNQIRHFCAVIEGTETPRITAADATRSLRATLAVFEAAQTGRRIEV